MLYEVITPEVAHTDDGDVILHNFLFKIAGVKPGWTMASFVESTVADLRAKIGDAKVICA